MPVAKSFENQKYVIKKFPIWTLLLHTNQSYLGRAICYLNTPKENLANLELAEFSALKKIIVQYQAALIALWRPDWWNFAVLGNTIPQLHVHFIPRYKTKRTFRGVEFLDERAGKNYAPAPERKENEVINQAITKIIKRTMR